MKLYFAPMEGITTYTYRNAHAEMFGMCDIYYAPFIVPTENERISSRTMRDILPQNNVANTVPQVLCNSPKAFGEFSEKVMALGYDELNLNFGCPAATVIGKKRGSGALKDTDWLDKFLNEVFSGANRNISVKTRTGFYSHNEFDEILKIYNKYPISLLIIHPRVREEFYIGKANLESFGKAYKCSKAKLCYNGDIRSVEDYEKIIGKFDGIDSVMIGRGAIANPAIFREIRGGAQLKTEELIAFSNLLEERYLSLYKAELPTLHKLKAIWMYVIMNFPEEKKIAKAIKKANKLTEFNGAINCLPELI